jgi:hypothetical protein
MAYRYFRHTVTGALSARDAVRGLGDAGGVIVRIDTSQNQTVVTIALPEGRELGADSPLGAGVEISEGELLHFGGYCG